MAQAIGMLTWSKEGSVSLSQAKEWVSVTIIHDDGSMTRESFVRVGQQVGDSWTPPHLAGIPEVGAGGRSAGGQSWGIDLDQFQRGYIQNSVAGSVALREAAARCLEALRSVPA